MRPTLRLLANVKPRYLEPFAPTGITGLLTHPSPRPTLIFLYQSTLSKLKDFPESSVYRQSTEALTRQRLRIVESTKPPGFAEWLERVKSTVGAEPQRFASLRLEDGTYAATQKLDFGDPRGEDWDGEPLGQTTEGPHRTAAQEKQWDQVLNESTQEPHKSDFESMDLHWEAEPALEADQISHIEQQIAGGLIEEIIQVAEGELKLVNEMHKAKAWEELEERPSPGQWTYFERD